MDDFHWRLASSALAVAPRYGFALAGGHAVNAHGFLVRPTADVVATYCASGLDVRVEHESRYYVRFTVADPESGKEVKVELVADIRLMEPVLMAIGPVLHPDDVAAGKVEALFTRAEVQDWLQRGKDRKELPECLSYDRVGGADGLREQ